MLPSPRSDCYARWIGCQPTASLAVPAGECQVAGGVFIPPPALHTPAVSARRSPRISPALSDGFDELEDQPKPLLSRPQKGSFDPLHADGLTVVMGKIE